MSSCSGAGERAVLGQIKHVALGSICLLLVLCTAFKPYQAAAKACWRQKCTPVLLRCWWSCFKQMSLPCRAGGGGGGAARRAALQHGRATGRLPGYRVQGGRRAVGARVRAAGTWQGGSCCQCAKSRLPTRNLPGQERASLQSCCRPAWACQESFPCGVGSTTLLWERRAPGS